jgi:hypothetical protein
VLFQLDLAHRLGLVSAHENSEHARDQDSVFAAA